MFDNLLNTDSIIESAEIASGTSGLVDEELHDRIDALANWFRSQPGNTQSEHRATRRQIVQVLARRLGIAGDIARHPEILDERIEDPIFIVGFPRTGTSLLQSLLGADSANRTPVAWRVREPSPPPGEQAVTPYRRERAAAEVSRWVERCPGLLALHPYWDEGAECAIEDEEIFTLDFLNAYPSLLFDAPNLAMMVSINDGPAAYGFLKQFMQHQQWRCPKKRWIMKGVEHQRQLPALFEVFPNARCIWPHREPGSFLPSNLAIAATVYDGITSGALDRKTIASGYMNSFRAEIERILADPSLGDSRILHVPFTEIIADPVAALRNAYAAWDFDFSAETEAAMRTWLASDANRSDRYGRHHYDFAPFGIDWAAETARYQPYRTRFLAKETASTTV